MKVATAVLPATLPSPARPRMGNQTWGRLLHNVANAWVEGATITDPLTYGHYLRALSVRRHAPQVRTESAEPERRPDVHRDIHSAASSAHS